MGILEELAPKAAANNIEAQAAFNAIDKAGLLRSGGLLITQWTAPVLDRARAEHQLAMKAK